MRNMTAVEVLARKSSDPLVKKLLAEHSDNIQLLLEVYLAIDAKHGINTLRVRQNALSPRIEMALEAIRGKFSLPQSPTSKEAFADARRVYGE